MRFVSLGAACCAGLVWSGGAAAQNGSGDGVALDEIVVTAARAPRSIAETPQSVQVIDRGEITKQLELTSSPSAVLSKLVPGFSVPNQTISSASETFRGRNLLVLIDGVPLNTPLRDVSRILNLIDLNSVERIELVAGASSLFSAGATGGTVNFITRRATDGAPVVTLNTALRAFTTDVGHSLAPEVSLGVTGRVPNGIDYAFVGSGRFASRTYDGSGREMASDGLLGQGGGDRFQNGNALAKIGYDIDAAKRLEFSFTQIYLNQDPRYFTDYNRYAHPDYTRLYDGQSVLEDTRSFSLRYTDADFALGSLSLLGFYNDIKKRFNLSTFAYPANPFVTYSFNPNSPTSPTFQSTLFSERGGINATIDTPLDMILPGLKLTWGADANHETTRQRSTDGSDIFTPLEQTSVAGFGQLQLPVGDRLTLRAGARYETFDLKVDGFTRPATFAAQAARTPLGYSTFVLPALAVTGGDFSYDSPTFNAGATFKLTETSELFGGFSQGFALPDVGAFTRRAGLSLAFACTVARPNCLPAGTSISYASIAPETQLVNNYEFGVRGRYEIFTASLSGFISTSDRGTTFDTTTNVITQQKEMIYGVEFTGEAAVSQNVSLGTTLGYREGRYDTNKDGKLDSWLPNNRIASPFHGTVSGTYRFDNGVAIRLEGEGFSGRDVRTDLTGAHFAIPAAMTMNANISAPVMGGQLYASANNLFDTRYKDPTATAVRNLDVYGFGRTVTLGYRITF
jgi:iron complex outermembrane receptor protein